MIDWKRKIIILGLEKFQMIIYIFVCSLYLIKRFLAHHVFGGMLNQRLIEKTC